MVTAARCCQPQAIFKATIIHQSDLAGTPPGGLNRFFRFCRAEGCVILAACALAARDRKRPGLVPSGRRRIMQARLET
jgi:hypothetical protein